MRMMKSVFIAVAATFAFCMSLTAALAKDEAKLVASADRAMKEITAITRNGIPPVMFSNAGAIAIIPGAAKNDFMVSGKSAGGVMLVREKDGKWSSPVFVTLSGGTLGWQVVGGPMDIILLFKNKERIDAVMKGKLHLDAKVSMFQGPLGKAIKVASKKVQNAEIISYVRSHGDIYDVTVSGSTIQLDNAANDDFYGKTKIVSADIVSGKVEKTSDDLKSLQKLLTDYAARKQ